MSSRRVLFWCGSFWPKIGGVEVRAAKLLPGLRQRGYEFVVVTGLNSPNLPAQSTLKGIPIYRFPFFDVANDVDKAMLVRRQIEDLKRSFAPHLIHRNGVGADNFFYLTTANTHRAPLLLTLINDLRESSIRSDTVLGHLLRSANWVSTVSSAALRRVRELVPDIIARSSVIHNGITPESFSPAPAPAIPRLLCLGRLVPQKGIDIALKAMTLVIKHCPRARLVIAGDGVERRALEEQAARFGLSQATEFLGWIAPRQVPILISSATMLLMPSRWEGLPNVALQAGLVGRPVVGSRVGGLPEIVDHQQTGLLIEKENITALADAITFLLDNPEIAAQMGEAGRVRVTQEFSWDRYIDAYDALYRQIIHGA